MTSISDSDAFLNPERLLPQHQAAIQILSNILADPKNSNVDWLDLACGKGQILGQLNLNLQEDARKKISFVGYDLNIEFGRITEKSARALLFNSAQIEYGALENFSKILGRQKFNFITLTNTLHEITPTMVPEILLSCIDQLSDDGILYVYDMESLIPPELGATPWKGSEIQSVVDVILNKMGVKKYKPFVGSWAHSKVRGWSFSIQKALITADAVQIGFGREDALNSATNKVVEILNRRRVGCHAALESLTRFGASTEKEASQKIDLLYEYWSVQLALENAKR